jgi:apoptosis-inducing factor 3
VVLGASFIGLEVAASLRARSLEVDVVAPERIPFERVLGAELGGALEEVHREHGVKFHLERSVTAIGENDVTLSTGEQLSADLVVIGVGVRPRLSLMEGTLIALDRGVLVNELLETSVAGIFAAGDIARWPDAHSGERIRVEHWVVAQRQGQTAARNMLGRAEPFTAVPFFWTRHYDLAISYVGHAERWDAIDISGDVRRGDCALKYRRGSRVLAVATIFRDRESLEAEVALERGDEDALLTLAATA